MVVAPSGVTKLLTIVGRDDALETRHRIHLRVLVWQFRLLDDAPVFGSEFHAGVHPR